MTTSQLNQVLEILNDFPSGNVKEITNEHVICESVTRSQVLELDKISHIGAGIAIVPNDANTIRIIL